MSDQKPAEGQNVYYFFKHVGVHKGKYSRQELDASLFGAGVMADCFYGDMGWLCDDVTHWMPRENATCFPPDEPKE